MLYLNAEAVTSPKKVTVEVLPEGKTLVRLADNIKKNKDPETEQTTYQYNEVVFYMPDDRTEETAESIQEDFNGWWIFGQEEEQEATLEDRIAALEEMYLLGLEVETDAE